MSSSVSEQRVLYAQISFNTTEQKNGKENIYHTLVDYYWRMSLVVFIDNTTTSEVNKKKIRYRTSFLFCDIIPLYFYKSVQQLLL